MILEKEKEVKKGVLTFSKERLLNCKKYRGKTDILDAILKQGESYSFSRVDKMIKEFLAKAVD